MNRRSFINRTALTAVGIALTGHTYALLQNGTYHAAEQAQSDKAKFRPLTRSGFGGVPLGNGFQYNSDVECL